MCIKVGKCCCCVDLRTGAILIAVLGIVGSLGSLALKTDWITITEVILGVLVYFCLLYGAIKINTIAVLIFLILDVIQIILVFAEGILFLVGGSLLNVVSQGEAVGIAAIIIGVCIILWACLQIYFFICIHSFYKKIIKGKTTSSATVTVERVTERVTVT